ncbi:unnamed protein product [Arabis nemorensis]|uniref:Uncharacterized protein n=1 Tax=Arabis nemorensis TaxID=586526 RepID=A0A565AMR6_9BRAS|nr:unnamed protein product [Arabis nemorensis]
MAMGWSGLTSDVLSLVYNRLSFADFARAKTVCSSWYSVSRSSSPRKINVPWLIFKQDRNWKLFDPEEGKFYTTQISRLGFADCSSVATCGNWVLVTDNIYLYMVNPFTLEIIIDLPPLKPYGKFKILDNCPIHFNYGLASRQSAEVKSAVLWVDERTKDYLVVWWSRGSDCIRFCVKGDEEWTITPGDYRYVDHMVYKDKKVYILTAYGRGIRILDFSQDFPREVFNHPYLNRGFRFGSWDDRPKMRLTTSGDVLMICRVPQSHKKFQLKVYKMNSTNEDWEIVNSLDEVEALAWDFCDYYWDCCDYFWDYESSFLKASTYEILTQKIQRLRDMVGVSDERWFLPCF